ncbi:MAG: hypothetical protein QOJ99_2756 [Bryobacterales bacterium]|nr:hypothetical protein [Bryobacterales bacterium]
MSNKQNETRSLVAILGLYMTCSLGCAVPGKENKTNINSSETSVKAAGKPAAEQKSGESKSVDSRVAGEVERMEAEKRATLLQDAKSAIDETYNALAALDKGDKQSALAALERVTGKLDVLVARDPKLANAPMAVSTVVLDLYATPATVKSVVAKARSDLASERVQDARHLVENLASEADIQVTGIPLGTYPAAIRAVAPLVDAGKLDAAKAALYAALHTLVVDIYVVPLPKVRADAMIAAANEIANKRDRNDDDKAKLRGYIEATRVELQLAEALGYGTKDSYKPLYAEIDDIQKKAEGGASGKGLFDKLRQSVKNFKFTV